MPTVLKDDCLRVFISYSRRDAAAADALVEDLCARGFKAEIDRRNLPFGEKWQTELSELIRLSDTVIWLISEASIHSKWVNWELDEVAKRKKRLVPVLIGDTPRDKLPRQLGEIQILPSEGVFESSRDLDVLARVLETDQAWLKEGSRLSDRASEWVVNGRTSALLLRGATLIAADRWKESRPPHTPAPHQDVLELVLASRKAATRRQRWWVGGALTIALGSISLAGYAYLQRATALNARDDALLRESKYLTDRSGQATSAQHDPTIGALLAIEALPYLHSDDQVRRERPEWPPAGIRLDAARRATREQAVIPIPANGALGVSSVALIPDGNGFLTGGHDNTVRRWDIVSKREIKRLEGHAAQVTSIALTSTGARAVTGSRDSTARVWDLHSGRELAVLKGHKNWIDRLAVSSDDKRAVTASWDNTARVWDIENFKELAVLQHSGIVLSVAISRDASRIFTGSQDQTLRVWDTATGREIQSLQMPAAVSSLCLTKDDKYVIVGLADKTIRLLDGGTRAELAKLTGHDADVTHVVAVPNSTRLLSASRDGIIRLWDVPSRTQIALLQGHDSHAFVAEDRVSGMAVTGDGKWLLTGGQYDSTARIWDLSDVNRLRPDINAPKATRFAITPDGARLAVAAFDGTHRLLDLTNGQELYVRRGHLGISSLALSPDGKKLLTGGDPDHTLQVWSLDGGDRSSQFSYGSPVMAIAATSDSKHALVGLKNGRALLWDLNSGRENFELRGHTGEITSVAIASNRNLLITGSKDETARVWDGATGQQIFVLKGHEGVVTSVATTPDGTRAVTGSGLRDGPIIRPIKDNSARVWNLATGRQLALLKGHVDSVTTVAVTSDGTRVVTGSQDGTVRVWDISTGVELGVILSGMSPIKHVVVAPDNSVLALTQFGLIKFVKIFPFGQALIEDSIRAVPRCMTPAERQQFYLTSTPPSWCMGLSKWPYDRIGALDMGFRLLVAGRESEAETLFSAVRPHNPDLAGSITRVWTKSYIARGKTLIDQGKDAEAEQEFARALSRDAAIADEIKRAWTDAYMARGRAHLEKNELSEADARFNAAIQRDQSLSTQIVNLKREHIQRQVSTSLKRTQALLEQANRGESSDAALTEALATANGVLRFQNDHPEVLMFRGLVHMARNNLDEALADLNGAIANGIRMPPAYFARGLCNEKMGKNDAAIADFQAVLAAGEVTDLVKTLQAQAKQRLISLVGNNRVIQLPQTDPLGK